MEKKVNGTSSLVLGIISVSIAVVFMSLFPLLEIAALALGIIAIVLGASASKVSGKGKAGLILGIIGTSISGFFVLILFFYLTMIFLILI